MERASLPNTAENWVVSAVWVGPAPSGVIHWRRHQICGRSGYKAPQIRLGLCTGAATLAQEGSYRELMTRQSNAKILKKSVEWENPLGYLGGDGSEGHIRNFGLDVFVCAPPKAWAMAVVGTFLDSKFWKMREAVVFKPLKQRPPPPAAGAARSRRKQVSGQASK